MFIWINKKELDTIMSALSDFVKKVNDNDATIAASLATFSDGFAKLVVTVTSLEDIITKLQASAGAVTPEDQALIDAAEKASDAVVAQAKAIVVPTPPDPAVLPVPQSTL